MKNGMSSLVIKKSNFIICRHLLFGLMVHDLQDRAFKVESSRAEDGH